MRLIFSIIVFIIVAISAWSQKITDIVNIRVQYRASYSISPGGALNACALSAYRVFLTADPRRSSLTMLSLPAFF